MSARSLLVIGAIAGAATLGYVALDPRRALLAWTAAFVMATLTGISGLILVFVLELVNAKWWLAVRAPFLAVARIPVIAPLFFLPIAVFGGRLYPNYGVGFLVRSAVYLAVWALLASRKPSKTLAPPGILLLAFTLTAAAFDWLMALQSGWSSSLYGVWMFAEGFAGAMAAIAVGTHFMGRAKILPDGVTADHFGAIGRLILCSVLVWAYIGFFQLLLVWLPDLPREVAFYTARTEGAWAVVSGLIVARFVIAFLLLLSRPLKRTSRGIAAIGGLLIVTQAIDCAWIVLPSVGAKLSPLDALPFICVIAVGWAFGVRVAIRIPLAAELDLALRYRSP